MKKIFLHGTVTLFFCLFTLLALSPTAKAEGPAAPSGTVQQQITLFDTPQTLNLPRNNTSFWFILPKGTTLGDESTLTLPIRVTGTLLRDYSTVTLSLNNVQLASAHILDVVEKDGGVWQVTIPAKNIKTDGTLNELRITTAQRSVLGDCADIDNPANWVTLEDTAVLSLNILDKSAPELNTLLPHFFNSPSQSNQTRASFILPANPNSDVLSALLTTANAIGAEFPAKNTVNFAVSQRAESNYENHVFIGLADSFSAANFTVPSLGAENGYLAVNPQDGYNNALLLGADAKGLEKAAAFFTHAKYLAQLSGSSAVITTDLSNRAPNFTKKEDGYYTLGDYGYNSINMAGAFHQSTTFTIPQPQGVRSGQASYVELNFKHAKALLADASLLTVYINDIPVNSIQLSDSNAENGKIKATIPAEALEQETIRLKIESYHYLGKIDCSKDYSDTAWTAIDKSSVIYFEPGNTSVQPTLQSFPTFYPADASNQSAQPILLATPTEASQTVLETAATIACRAGQNAASARTWRYTTALADEADKANSDIVLIGSQQNLDIPSEIAEKLYIVPQKNGEFLVSDTSAVSQEALQNKVILQVIRSPWNFAKKVYVIVYPNDAENLLKQTVSSRKSLNEMRTAAALINYDGTIVNLTDTLTVAASKLPLTPDRIIGNIVRMTGIPRVGLLVIALCILLIIILMVKVISNRNRFVNAKRKMEKINAGTGKHADLSSESSTDDTTEPPIDD